MSKSFVYVMRGGGYFKAGISDDVHVRAKYMNAGQIPFPVRIVCFAQCDPRHAGRLEVALFNLLGERAQGEWFVDDGRDDSALVSALATASRLASARTGFTLFRDHPADVALAIHEAAKGDVLDAGRRARDIFERITPAGAADGAPQHWQEIGKVAETIRRAPRPMRGEVGPSEPKMRQKAKMLARLRRIREKAEQ